MVQTASTEKMLESRMVIRLKKKLKHQKRCVK